MVWFSFYCNAAVELPSIVMIMIFHRWTDFSPSQSPYRQLRIVLPSHQVSLNFPFACSK